MIPITFSLSPAPRIAGPQTKVVAKVQDISRAPILATSRMVILFVFVTLKPASDSSIAGTHKENALRRWDRLQNVVYAIANKRVWLGENERYQLGTERDLPTLQHAMAFVPVAKRRRNWSADESRQRFYPPVK